MKFVRWDFELTNQHPRGPLQRNMAWHQGQPVNIARLDNDELTTRILGFPNCGHLRVFDPAAPNNPPWLPGRLTLDGVRANRPIKVRITNTHPAQANSVSDVECPHIVNDDNQPNEISDWVNDLVGNGPPDVGGVWARIWRDREALTALNHRDVWFPWSMALYSPRTTMADMRPAYRTPGGRVDPPFLAGDDIIRWEFGCTGSIIGAKWFIT